jgi:hypothetical protein
MTGMPAAVAEFLSGRRFGVAGVARHPGSAANPVFHKLRTTGYEAFPINPNATEVEGVRCYPDVGAIPGPLDGVVVATHPHVSVEIVRQCAERGVGRVWLHRSFGTGSVSDAAVRECQARGIQCIVGGCPLMYCEPVDIGHRCMRWWLTRTGRIAG